MSKEPTVRATRDGSAPDCFPPWGMLFVSVRRPQESIPSAARAAFSLVIFAAKSLIRSIAYLFKPPFFDGKLPNLILVGDSSHQVCRLGRFLREIRIPVFDNILPEKDTNIMSKANQTIQALLKSPLLWGILGSVGFYASLRPVYVPIIKRYFTGHPVEYMETAPLAIGLAALVIKLFDTVAQRTGLNNSPLGEAPCEKGTIPFSADTKIGTVLKASQPAEACKTLLQKLDDLPGWRQGDYYVCATSCGIEAHSAADVGRLRLTTS